MTNEPTWVHDAATLNREGTADEALVPTTPMRTGDQTPATRRKTTSNTTNEANRTLP